MNIHAYFRIRLPSQDDIIDMAIAKEQGRDMMGILQPYIDVAMRPFDDQVPCILPEELAELINTLTIEIR